MIVALDLESSIPLAAAVVERLARDCGVRVLVIKGPVAEAYGLRPPRGSSDLDVLVESGRYELFLAALAEVGWTADPEMGDMPNAVRNHSATLLNGDGGWPLSLDVHQRFPGFLAESGTVFDELWACRAEIALAGCLLPVPSRPGAALVQILNAIRSHYTAEYEYLQTMARAGELDLQEMARLAEVTGAAVGPFFAELGLAEPRLDADPAHRAEWALETHVGFTTSLAWVAAFRSSPPWRWPALLWRALWPSDHLIRVRFNAPDVRGLQLLRLRWRRLAQGLGDLPEAARLVLRRR